MTPLGPRRLAAALAAAAPLAARAAEVQEGLPVGAALQSLAALGLVLAAIVGAAWMLRRFQGAGAASSALVRTIAAAPVGPRERVVLVEIGDTWLVLGVAQGAVRTLHTLPRGEVPSAAPAGFAALLARAKAGRRDG
jgi:flagellar protein FliO/FliZ